MGKPKDNKFTKGITEGGIYAFSSVPNKPKTTPTCKNVRSKRNNLILLIEI